MTKLARINCHWQSHSNSVVNATSFYDVLLRSYLYHCVWSVITAHNLTPEKRDNNYLPHPQTLTTRLRSTFKL